MKSLHIISIFLLTFISVRAKISGGPRGRFDKNMPTKSRNQHVSAHHAHYSYHPPSEIHFLCRQCHNFVSYPVYHGLPPTYVYKYRERGGRFGDLLTGLALYNLGRASMDHWEYTHFYSLRQDEKCSLHVINGKHFEETQIPCFIMSSFMERSPESHFPDPAALDITSSQIDIKPFMNSTGSPIKVTRDQECVVWHNTSMGTEKSEIPCALLKEYAETMKPSGIPVYVWLPVTLIVVVAIYVCCQCCCYKKKTVKEEVPLNRPIVGYCSQY
ncbi:uncharacterized protein [Epargyreus clarus]|uniref:uncharacterized protein n=1 Tax=Epargyreus clarus TaxID=520877 RepID=UPI003C2E5C24